MSSPFYLWSTLANFYTTASGPINGDLWDTSNIDDGGDPIVVDDATSATGYVAGEAETYTIYLTSQDWLLTQQPAIVVATTTVVDLPSHNGVDDLAAATITSVSGNTGAGAVFYWKASSTAGDYALAYQPFTTTYVAAPSTGPNTVLKGSPITVLPAVQTPVFWDFSTFTATSTQAAETLFMYATAASSTTQDVWLVGINGSGGVTSGPIQAGTFPTGTWFAVSNDSGSNSGFTFDYSAVIGSDTGFYYEDFNPLTGELGDPNSYLLTPAYKSLTGEDGRVLSDGTHLRFVEGVLTNGQAVIQDFIGDGAPTAIATIDLSSATDRYSVVGVDDPADGKTDYTAVAYADRNQVYLELFNASGVEIGTPFIVPGITSFDRIHTLTGGDSARVEIDYTVADPSGGDEVEGYIYDTISAGLVYTLSGGGEYIGSTFDDTITDAPGFYWVNGGGGADTFVVPEMANEAGLSVNAAGDFVVTTYDSTTFNSQTLTGATTLIRFTYIKLNNVEVTLSTSNGYTTAEISSGGLVTFQGTAPLSWTLSLASGGGVSLVGSVWQSVVANAATIDLTSSQATITGGGDAIAFVAGSDDAVSLYGTNGKWDGVTGSGGIVYLTSAQTNVTGGSDSIVFAGGSGNAVSLYGTNNHWDGIEGSDGAIYLTSSQTTVDGGGDSIDLSGAGNALGLSGTAGHWDGVSGAGATIYVESAQTTVTGGGDALFLSGSGDAVGLYGTNNKWDGVDGSSGVIYLTSAQTSVTGGGDAIYLDGTGDAVSLYDTSNKWDGVVGSTGVIYLTSSQTTVDGGGDSIDLSGAGNALGLSGTAGHWDGISGSGASIYVESAQTTVTGGGDALYLSGSGDAVGLYNTANSWDGVSGANSVVYLTSAQTTVSGGGDNTVVFSSGTGNAVGLSGTAGKADTVAGSNGTIYVTSAQANVGGGSDAVIFSGSSSVTASGASDSFDFAKGIGGKDVIGGFVSSDTIQFSKLDFASWSVLQGDITQSGANALITLNASDTVTMTGVTASNLVSTEFKLV